MFTEITFDSSTALTEKKLVLTSNFGHGRTMFIRPPACLVLNGACEAI
jgi:hypothetical protein